MRQGTAPLTLTDTSGLRPLLPTGAGLPPVVGSPLRVEREGLLCPNRTQEPPLPAGEGRGEGQPGTPR